MAGRFDSRLSVISLSDPNAGKWDGESGFFRHLPPSASRWTELKRVLMTHQANASIIGKCISIFQMATRMARE